MDQPGRLAAVAPEPELPPKERKAFALAREAARQVLQRRFRLLALVRDAYARMFQHDRALAKVREDLGVLLRLAHAWALRDYREIPWRSIVFAVAALIYFVNPADVIPDVLVGLGFVDDAAVIAGVVKAIRNDLEAFRRWEGRLLEGGAPRLEERG
jgi:uncharacterized membrane protein YkvA (DUF1232 family)